MRSIIATAIAVLFLASCESTGPQGTTATADSSATQVDTANTVAPTADSATADTTRWP